MNLQYEREGIQVKVLRHFIGVFSLRCGSRWRSLPETPGSFSAAVPSLWRPGRSSQPAGGWSGSLTPPAWPADLRLHPTKHQTPFSKRDVCGAACNTKPWVRIWKGVFFRFFFYVRLITQHKCHSLKILLDYKRSSFLNNNLLDISDNFILYNAYKTFKLFFCIIMCFLVHMKHPLWVYSTSHKFNRKLLHPNFLKIMRGRKVRIFTTFLYCQSLPDINRRGHFKTTTQLFKL